MLKKLMAGAVAGLLLAGASNVMAQFVDVWVYAGVQSTSGTVGDTLAGEPYLLDPADFCIQGVSALRDLGFTFQGATPLEPEISALLYESSDDSAVLYCVLEGVGEGV